MRTPTLKKTGLLCSLVAALLVGQHSASAQISVGPSGLAPQTFDTLPPATSWSQRSTPGGAGDITTAAVMDAQVQTNSASLITAALVSTPGNPPAASANGMWASEGRYALTRATGNRFAIMMATLRNNSGSNHTVINVSYSLTNLLPVAEQIPGNSFYFSLSGAAGSWQKVTNLSGLSTSGTVGTNLVLGGTWSTGTDLYLLWSDDNGSGTPDTAVIIDNLAVSFLYPSVTTHPQDSTVAPGQNVTLTVGASGEQPLFYQWYKNSNIIAGATSSAYTLVNAQPADAGYYMVVVSNAFGTARSSNALVVVNCSAPATFTSALADQAVAEGQTLSLTAATTGTAPIYYQWYRNGVAISGATNATYSKVNVQIADAGIYTVVIDNCAQLTSSDDAVVGVSAPPYILTGLTNTVWRYNQADGDLGTAWRAANYVDSAWPTGNALLAVENLAALNPLINTVLSLAPGGSQIPTYYFRTKVVLTNDPALITLLASNYFDDGAVVYVNGVEAFRYNMPAGNIAWATLAPVANPAGEGTFVVSNIPSSLLVLGTNTIAVEVHQNSLTSSDIVFGMGLQVNFITPTALVITNPPQGIVVEETKPTVLTVGLQGAPAYFQWYKDGVAVSNGTSNPLIIPFTTTNDAGCYTVVATNVINSVTSSPCAVLTVISDTNPPVIVGADGSAPASASWTNVVVSFSEFINATNATNIANYRITNTISGALVTITRATLQDGTNVVLHTAARTPFQNYILVVNRIRDISLAGNIIATNSSYPIRSLVNLFSYSSHWRWYDPFGPPFGSDVEDLGTAWKEVSYVFPSYWKPDQFVPYDQAVFYDGADQGDVPETVNTPLLQSSSITSFYRNGFDLQELPSPGGLRVPLTHIVDDGAVFWLNGAELFRFNMPTGTVVYNTLASAQVVNISRVVENIPYTGLVKGSNVLAVEVHTSTSVDVDKAFGAQLEVSAQSYVVGPVVITGGPTDVTVRESASATFQVVQAGGLNFQWQVNSNNIVGATNDSYTIPVVTAAMNNNKYRVQVSSAGGGSIFSTNATLRVILDTNRPTIVAARLVSANSVLVSFSETMAVGPAQTTGNYLVTNSVGAVASVSSAVLNNGTNVLLTFAAALNGQNTVVINNLTDASTLANVIAPNSAITVGVDYRVEFTSAWKYLLVNTNEEIQTSYFAPSFDDSAWRGPSNAVLYVEDAAMPLPKNTLLSMFADAPSNLQRINTHYFRQRFTALAAATNLTMSVRHLIDDGLVLYLNGTEIYRYNMGAGAITAASQAVANVGDATIIGPSNVVVNLLAGTNVLAAEVHQNGATSSDVVFALELTGGIPSVVPLPPPALEPVRIVEQPRSRTNAVASTAFFRSTATGAPPITLQWFKDGVALAGQTNSLLVIPNLTTANMTNYTMRASNAFSFAISSNAVLTVTGAVQCTSIPWQTGFKLGTNGLRTSITYSNGTTRAVLTWSNPVTNSCNSNATVYLQRSIGLRTPSANTLWTNVFTNVSGTVTVTNALTGTNTVYYRLTVP